MTEEQIKFVVDFCFFHPYFTGTIVIKDGKIMKLGEVDISKWKEKEKEK